MIFFQAIKHHLPAAAERILAAIDAGDPGRAALLAEILPIGAAGIVDVYEGALTPADIAGELAAWLAARDLAGREAFLEHLRTAGDLRRLGHYLVVDLSDASRFCLRGIEEGESFVHAHPARRSPHTFRIRPPTLKTAILAHYLARARGADPLDLALVDEARAWIDLPPLGELPEGIREAIERLGRKIDGRR